jgi:hypothetical protein
MKLIEGITAAHKCGVPLVGIATPDPAATLRNIAENVSPDSPKVVWNVIDGFKPLNQAGQQIVGDLGGCESNVLSAIKAAGNTPDETMVFILMSNRFYSMPPAIQAIWLLRDRFKMNGRMLVLVGHSMADLPPELARDVVVFDEPLPNDQELAQVVKDLSESANVQVDNATTGEIINAVRGLSAFEAEQAIAMSMSKDGVRVNDVWSRKVTTIEKTKGLQCFKGTERFDQIAGCDQVKKYLGGLMTGPMKPRAVVWLDEIEKSGLGHTKDLSGVNSDQLGTVLSYMEDRKVFGLMLVGVPGCGKSQLCKAMGSEFDRLVIRMDMGEMQGSLVGESQQNLRTALKTVDAIAGDNALFVATSNSIEGLDGALKSRFTDTFFFDLPNKQQLAAAWQIHMAAFKLPDQQLPDDTGWSGRNVQRCCQKAYSLGCSLLDAATFVIPEAIRSRDEIAKLRMQATGKYLSSDFPGAFAGEAQATFDRETFKRRTAI